MKIILILIIIIHCGELQKTAEGTDTEILVDLCRPLKTAEATDTVAVIMWQILHYHLSLAWGPLSYIYCMKMWSTC